MLIALCFILVITVLICCIIFQYLKIKMSEAETGGADFVNGSAFFGFMGVTMALVLASTYILTKILEQPMVQPKQAQA